MAKYYKYTPREDLVSALKEASSNYKDPQARARFVNPLVENIDEFNTLCLYFPNMHLTAKKKVKRVVCSVNGVELPVEYFKCEEIKE